MTNKKNTKKLKWYYIAAIPFWFLVFWVLFGHPFQKIPYIFSHFFCVIVLIINIWKQWEPYEIEDYKTEEKVYEYVERNTYYLIMSITIFLLISINRDSRIFSENMIDFNLVIYSQACAISFCVIVIALFWMPTGDEKAHHLVNLRHIKTVIFTYALSLFFISPIEVFIKLRDTF